MNKYSRPSFSPGRISRVVADTGSCSSPKRSRRARTSVPLPAPEGPVTTKTGLGIVRRAGLAAEETDQLRALALGEPADRLRLADARLVQVARRLHAPELGHGHQD